MATTEAESFTNTHNVRYSLGKGNGFPTQRRPKLRDLSEAKQEIIEAWFEDSKMANTP